MSHDFFNRQFAAGEKTFRVPCYLDDNKLSDEQREQLLDTMKNTLGAAYFNDKKLFDDILRSHRMDAMPPHRSYGPYIGVCINNQGDLMITSFVNAPAGSTVYDYEQFMALADQLDVKPLNPSLGQPQPAKNTQAPRF